MWEEAKDQIALTSGVLILDDTTLDKPYARHIELVTRHWSGKHHRVVQGINLPTLLWSDGLRLIPVDYWIYHKARDRLTKNDHFRAMIRTALERGFAPECVLFDSWYTGLDNLKALRSYGWPWRTRLKKNRHLNPDGSGNRALDTCDIAAQGSQVHRSHKREHRGRGILGHERAAEQRDRARVLCSALLRH